MPELTPTDLTILEIERQWWAFPGAKEAVIRKRLDMSATRYYQLVNAMIDRPEVEAHDPLTVRRLRRIRAERQRSRHRAV